MDGLPRDTYSGRARSSTRNTGCRLCYGTSYGKIQPTAHHHVRTALPRSMAAASRQTTPNGSRTARGGHQPSARLGSPSRSHGAASRTQANTSGGWKDDRWQKRDLGSPSRSHGPAPDNPDERATQKSLVQLRRHPYARRRRTPNQRATRKSLAQLWHSPSHTGHTTGTPNDNPAGRQPHDC